MRRGFSVFTPMVGTLVILITMLIVSSIILSERIAVQGSVKSYRSSELVNIASEAQSRVIEEVRASITSRLEDYSIQGEPVMAIVVNETNCPNKEVADELFNPPERLCGIDSNGNPDYSCTGGDSCFANSFWEVNATASNELTSKALLESSIQHTIAGIVGKYSLINITAKDVEFTDIVKGISFKGRCDSEVCDDGRLEIVVDFASMADEPIAEIASEGKRLQVFLPAEERTYTTRDPYMQYAKLTSDLFSQLDLMDNTWHGAGGTAEHDANYESTDGSEWFHYKYALQERYYGSPGKNTMGSAWAPGFYATEDDIVDDYFADGKSVSDYMTDLLADDTSDWSIIEGWTEYSDTDMAERQQVQNLRFDSVFEDSEWGKTAELVSGYAAQTSGALKTLPEFGSPAQQTIFPGGCLSPNALRCDVSSTGNCLATDTTFSEAKPYELGTTLVNTTGDYDLRFNDTSTSNPASMKNLVDALKSQMTDELTVGMGLDKNSLNYKLVVLSKQYYLEGNGFQGLDNWHCGQFMTLYQPAASMSSDAVTAAGAANTCEATRKMYSGTLASGGFPTCDPATGACKPCDAEDDQNCPWFVSEPVNWTCDTLTLYRVEEVYRLYRSTPQSDVPDRPVFAATYKRMKDDYAPEEEGEHNYTLWTEYSRYSDTVSKDGIKEAYEFQVNNVRRCTYAYDTSTEEDPTTDCAWMRSDELEE